MAGDSHTTSASAALVVDKWASQSLNASIICCL